MRKFIIGILICSAIMLFVIMLHMRSAKAEDEIVYGPYAAEFIKVVDGDTIEMRLFVFPNIEAAYPIRILGIDTAELRSRDACEKEYAIKARQFAENWFGQGNGIFYVYNIMPDAFGGRMLGGISTQENEDYALAIMNAKLAKRYGLSPKDQPWCIGMPELKKQQ